jgi:hypothetical protein
MRIESCFGAIILAAACSFSFAAPPGAGTTQPADSLLTKEQAKDVNAVIDSMFAAGFPDTRKSVVYTGKLAVSATFDPSKGPPPLPSSASSMQMTIPNSTKMTYGYAFEGLHFKLADGSWVISLAYRFKPAAGDTVGTADAKEVNLATLTADAIAASPFDAEKQATKWLAMVAPDRRALSRDTMNRFVPLTNYLQIDADSWAPAAVLLQRAGWSDAADFSLAVADVRARSYWQLHPWSTPDSPFDPTGEYKAMNDEAQAWSAAQKQFTFEPPPVALRRAMFRVCRAQLMIPEPEDALLPIPVAAAAARAAVDPKDPQKNAARIDAMEAGAKLPVYPEENADIAARLQTWEARPRMPRMVVTGNGGGGPSISTGFVAPTPAYKPDKADLDALVALLADERPSRFFEFSGPRTVGDNAWRAVAELLKGDPRTLAGYPTDKAWTAAERKAATGAVQKWWKEHRKEFVEK